MAWKLSKRQKHTVRGIRSDFPGMYKDMMCPLGCGEKDTIQNVLTCRVLKQNYRSNEISICEVEFKDIFSQDINKQKQVTEIYEKLLEIRNSLISSNPNPNSQNLILFTSSV